MSAELSPVAPAPKRRSEPQAQTPGRAPACPDCWWLEDVAGHFWACGWVTITFRPDPLADVEAAS
jgi:hypothetical protein